MCIRTCCCAVTYGRYGSLTAVSNSCCACALEHGESSGSNVVAVSETEVVDVH